MIRLHLPCLTELLDEHCIGSSLDASKDLDTEYMSPALLKLLEKKLYNCPSCHSSVTGDDVGSLVELYSMVSKQFPDKTFELTSAMRVIDDHIGRNQNPLLKGDEFLRYQLGVYKLYLKTKGDE